MQRYSKYLLPLALPKMAAATRPGLLYKMMMMIDLQALRPELIPVSAPLGCYYFPPGLLLPSQPESITALWLVPFYFAL